MCIYETELCREKTSTGANSVLYPIEGTFDFVVYFFIKPV